MYSNLHQTDLSKLQMRATYHKIYTFYSIWLHYVHTYVQFSFHLGANDTVELASQHPFG